MQGGLYAWIEHNPWFIGIAVAYELFNAIV